jgi:hypothetical protein
MVDISISDIKNFSSAALVSVLVELRKIRWVVEIHFKWPNI